MIQTSGGLSLILLISMLYKRHGVSLLAESLLDPQEGTLVYIIIINIIIISSSSSFLHELGLTGPVSTSSNAHFQGLPSPIRPFGL
jgi:hypothetical protein